MYSALSIKESLAEVSSRVEGLTGEEVTERLVKFGRNSLPHKKRSLIALFARQLFLRVEIFLDRRVAFKIILNELIGFRHRAFRFQMRSEQSELITRRDLDTDFREAAAHAETPPGLLELQV